MKRYEVRDIYLIDKLFNFLIDNIANLFSLNSIIRKLKDIWINTNAITLGNYIRYLENSLVIYGVDRFDLKGKKILEGEKKYYLNDLCFKNFLSSTFDEAISKKLENYVFNVLRSKGYKIYVGYYGKNEIDFVAEKNELLYIQVAYLLYDEKVINREYGNLEKIKDNYPKIVVSMDDMELPSKEGIKHIQAWKLHERL